MFSCLLYVTSEAKSPLNLFVIVSSLRQRNYKYKQQYVPYTVGYVLYAHMYYKPTSGPLQPLPAYPHGYYSIRPPQFDVIYIIVYVIHVKFLHFLAGYLFPRTS